MLMELEKTMGIMPGTTICGLADGTAWATRTFINKFYDEFAAGCPQETKTSLSISRGRLNVLTPMGSNTGSEEEKLTSSICRPAQKCAKPGCPSCRIRISGLVRTANVVRRKLATPLSQAGGGEAAR